MDSTCSSESIYNLIPIDWKEPPQPPRYISVFKTSVKEDMQKFKTAMKTMGPPKVEVPSPKDFLKKHSKEKTLPPKKAFDRNKPKKPPVPLRTDHPVMGVQSEKNFINTNAANVIMEVAKKPKPIYVDKRTGDKHDLETSGLIPKHINKKDYGVTPKYICQRNEEVKKAQEEYDNYIQEKLRKAAMKRLSDEEREAVLQGLKKNWEEVHKEFQSLSIFIDSIPKRMRKQKLEEEMKQLEYDIGVIEKHKVIYIANK
ncbi:enkurin, TRPC channel interacting protein [Rhinolophus ferrumequinum]|uniref:Enkurin, TRPC channel interacting protein n=1 Tax=Rhinolophus ferrumequinum TaxID=59479 RepID=A0A671ETN2_RHIFE|nr:enkurin [Rhinolophus ferrumequinum]KAF6371657.1 enkurin, TRPC channel interacting protein [Rhinolophus ferrumequinum]